MSQGRAAMRFAPFSYPHKKPPLPYCLCLRYFQYILYLHRQFYAIIRSSTQIV